jgi:hypothetical protein
LETLLSFGEGEKSFITLATAQNFDNFQWIILIALKEICGMYYKKDYECK